MKVTSSVLARTLEFVAQSGPTWDPLPPFRWADQGGLRLDWQKHHDYQDLLSQTLLCMGGR